MKPVDFEYVVPQTVDDAVNYLASHGENARILAGGQSLVPLLNLRMVRPSILVDINGVDGLDYIEERDGGVAIGATARQADVEHSALIAGRCPLIVEALHEAGHPQIRNQGTVVGSLTHNDPAAELPAVAVALGARLTVAGPNEDRRTVDAADFFVSYFTTSLAPNELVTEVWFPAFEPQTGWSFMEIARRHGDFALAGVAATLTLADDGTIRDARIGLAGVADRPIRSAAAEEALRGQPATRDVFSAAGSAAAGDEAVDPASDIHATADYRRDVTAVLVERALATAARRAES